MNTTQEDLNRIYTDEELSVMLAQMRQAVKGFYYAAVETRCHPFIEFTGLMEEWLKIAEYAKEHGVDFASATEHNKTPMPIKRFHAEYLGEKFGCIFGPTFKHNRKAWQLFSNKVIGKNASRRP